jgi:hypothetical protein
LCGKVFPNYLGPLHFQHGVAHIARLERSIRGGTTARAALHFEIEKHGDERT